jgi:hypothetical protein
MSGTGSTRANSLHAIRLRILVAASARSYCTFGQFMRLRTRASEGAVHAAAIEAVSRSRAHEQRHSRARAAQSKRRARA